MKIVPGKKTMNVKKLLAVIVMCIMMMAPACSVKSVSAKETLTKKLYALISIENYGDIVLELDPNTAPLTVANFAELVENHFYDGLTFHRIINGFMIQGGDPNGNGTGGSEKKIVGEFEANGIPNELKHTRGVISMARSSNPNSASSQFFIMHQDAPHLDGQYAAFGKVISGIEVVDAICAFVPVTDNNGSVLRVNQPVITSIRMISAEDAAKITAEAE